MKISVRIVSMRISISPLLTWILLAMCVQAQAQQPWGLPSSVWHYNDPPFVGNPYSAFYLWEYLGDTVVADMPCSIIGNDDHEEYMYEQDGKVYYWLLGEFRKVYDFTAEQGDTIQLTYPVVLFNEDYTEVTDTVLNVRAVVEAVGSNTVTPTLTSFQVRMLPDTAFPTIQEHMWPVVTYTERIGSHGMMIERIVGADSPLFIPVALRCYSDMDIDHVESWWAQQSLPCDHQLNISVSDEPYQQTTSVYPNPATEMVWLKFKNTTGELVLCMYDMRGSRVFGPVVIEQDSWSLDIKPFSQGIYLLNATNSNTHSTQTFKLVIP